MKCNQSRPGFELVSSCPFPTTINITPRVLPSLFCFTKFNFFKMISDIWIIIGYVLWSSIALLKENGFTLKKRSFAQSAGAIEYIDCTSAEELDPSSNESLRYDIKQSDCDVPVMLGLWGMQSTPSLPSLPGSHWPESVLSMSQIELNCALMLNWIAINRTVLTFKLRTYVRLNCLK